MKKFTLACEPSIWEDAFLPTFSRHGWDYENTIVSNLNSLKIITLPWNVSSVTREEKISMIKILIESTLHNFKTHRRYLITQE